MKQFAERLRHLRTYKGLTLAQMAELLETTKTTLSRYENDKRVPDADFIIKAAQHFKVSADYLLCLSNNPLSVEDLLTSKLSSGTKKEQHKKMVELYAESEAQKIHQD